MKIRELNTIREQDRNVYELSDDGFEIMADDGRALFCVKINDKGKIEINTGCVCKHNGMTLDSKLRIFPRYANQVIIDRPLYN